MIWPLLLLPLIPTFLRFLLACHGSLINLRSDDDYAVLPFSPNDLSIADIVLVVCLFIGRSIRKTLGYGSSKAAKVSSNTQEHETSFSTSEHDVSLDLQRLELAMPLHIRSSDLHQYMKTISSTPLSTSSPESPPTDILTSRSTHLTLFLSAISEPALLLLLARRGCPIEPLGSVNARNHFKLLQPDLCKQIIKEALTTPPKTQTNPNPKPTTESLLENSVLASLPPKARRVKRGTEIDITVSIYTRTRIRESKTWSPNVEVFRQIFTILQFSSSSSSSTPHPTTPRSSGKPNTLTDVPASTLHTPPTLASYVKLSTRDALEWAELCKDYNPIHISAFAARAFGFKGVIAHGNCVVAKAMSTFAGVGLSSPGGGAEDVAAIYMDISFKRPIVVPSEVGVRNVGADEGGSEDEDGLRSGKVKIEIFEAEKVYTEIEIGRLNNEATS